MAGNDDKTSKTTKPGQSSEPQGDEKAAVMFGATLNFENTRKYSFDATGTSKITAKLVAVPPPSAFMEAVAQKARKD